MATEIKISGLPIASTIGDSDVLPIVQGGVTKKITKQIFESSIAGGVTEVVTGTGLTGGPIVSTGTVSLANTSVTPGSYINGNFTVDAQGRLTNAANGESTLSSIVLAAGGVTLTSDTSANITSISVAAGTWLVCGNVTFTSDISVNPLGAAWSSSVSATMPDTSKVALQANNDGPVLAMAIPAQLYTLGATTTIYLSCQATISAGTTKASGQIFATPCAI